MAGEVKIGSKGIKSVLKRYDYFQSIAEYIWNGFDAKATKIDLNYEANEVGYINKLEVVDNGYGIPHEKIKSKFEPLFESEKAIEIEPNRHLSATHGKNGVGRLTFFTFANHAIWETIYKKNGRYYTYRNEINENSLNNYSGLNAEVKEISSTHTGTTVSFINIKNISQGILDNTLKEYLKREFAWFLSLNKQHNYIININGIPLDFASIIGDSETVTFNFQEKKLKFIIHYIRWNEKINKEFSQYYYIDNTGIEKYKEFTTLNNKGDHFYHSVYIKSEYFDDFNFVKSDEGQKNFIGGTRSDIEFKNLQSELTNYLRKKRKPFLKKYADKLIDEYEKEGVFPKFPEGKIGEIKKEELETVVRELYEIQPIIFSSLNVEQKKTFLGFLDLLLQSDERNKIIEIIKHIVVLDSEERDELLSILNKTTLTGIIKTIKLIEDRYTVISQLKQLVFNKNLKASEPKHLQKLVEDHYWLFGEQYHLVTAAEPDFEEALKRFIYILSGEKPDVKLDHPNKEREMDIFMCRQNKYIDTIDNIVVELKNPSINLGEKELSQVKNYMQVILKQDQFNGNNILWEFYLVGNDFDTSGYIEGELENAKHHGERSLVFKHDNYKIYVKRWSEIFVELECRLEFLDQKLQLDRSKLIKDYKTADEIIVETTRSSAVLQKEVKLPN